MQDTAGLLKSKGNNLGQIMTGAPFPA